MQRALHFALELTAKPLLAGAMQEQPLPPDVLGLIKIAGGEPAALAEAQAVSGESVERIQEAAALYLRCILFAPAADHYRVLGANREIAQDRLREHLRWLMKWLHPDQTGSAWDSAFAERVSAAWDGLKTPERRARYDRAIGYRPLAARDTARRRPRLMRPRRRVPWIRREGEPARRRSATLLLLLVGAAAAAMLLVPQWRRGDPLAVEATGIAASVGGDLVPVQSRR